MEDRRRLPTKPGKLFRIHSTGVRATPDMRSNLGTGRGSGGGGGGAAVAVAASPEPEGSATSGRRPDTSWAMSAQGDCEYLVQRARELVQQDLWAAKAWLITARSLYPTDFNIQVRSGPAYCRRRGGMSLAAPAAPGWPPPVWPALRPSFPASL